MSYIIGSAAGTVWNYLNENGETTATKIAKETKLDTNLVQRAIGWLSSEDKLRFSKRGRSEVISLKVDV